MLSRLLIHEKTHSKPDLSVSANNLSPKGDYTLKKNFFDPSKSSPPNDFMIKLHMRMSLYNTTNQCNNDDNFINE